VCKSQASLPSEHTKQPESGEVDVFAGGLNIFLEQNLRIANGNIKNEPGQIFVPLVGQTACAVVRTKVIRTASPLR